MIVCHNAIVIIMAPRIGVCVIDVRIGGLCDAPTTRFGFRADKNIRSQSRTTQQVWKLGSKNQNVEFRRGVTSAKEARRVQKGYVSKNGKRQEQPTFPFAKQHSLIFFLFRIVSTVCTRLDFQLPFEEAVSN